MSEPNFGRRSSDEILIRLDQKMENISEVINSHKEWLIKHEERIQSCEQQHVRIKTIMAIAGGILTMIWTGTLYWFKELFKE